MASLRDQALQDDDEDIAKQFDARNRDVQRVIARARGRMKTDGTIEFAITEQTAERVRGEMPVQAGILNPFGVVHAGAMLWFADVCATTLVAGGAEVVPGAPGFPLGIQLSASFVGNQTEGVLRATSVLVKRGRQLSVVRTTITGAGERLLADVTTSHVPAQAKK